MRKHRTSSVVVVVVVGIAIAIGTGCREDAPTADGDTAASASNNTVVAATSNSTQSGAAGQTTSTSGQATATNNAKVASADSPDAQPEGTEVLSDEDEVVITQARKRRAPKSRGAEGGRARGPDGQIGLFAIEEDGVPLGQDTIRTPSRKSKSAVRSPKRPKRSVAVVSDDPGLNGLQMPKESVVMPDGVPDGVQQKADKSLGIVNDALSKSLERKGFDGKQFQQKSSVQNMMNQMKAMGGGDARFEELRQLAAVEQAARQAERTGIDPDAVFDGFENRTVSTERIVAKPMIETATDPLSTFSVDVDTGAYTLARARLREGYLPKPEQVRAEEFLNYFHYDYPEPQSDAFGVSLEAAANPFDGNRHLLRIGVQGRSVSDDERPPAHLTFLVDVSGSMFGPDKLGLAREALELVTRNLRPDDTVAIVTYARGANVQMWPAGANESDIVLANIAAIEPGGSSALDAGLRLAYEVASTHYDADDINRVVVMSDGRANVGETKPAAVLKTVRAGVEDGVMLSTIGFGAKAFNDKMMEKLADDGDGNYFFVDSYLEAQRVFGDRLCGTINTIAKDVKIQVEFDPNSVLKHRLVGYDNRKLAHNEFRDDAVDAGEIGAGHSVTALYELVLADTPAERLATVRVRHKPPKGNVAIESEFQFRSEELLPDVRQASADFKFAAAVALFAQALKGEQRADAARINLIGEIAREGVADMANQPDRAEFLELVAEAQPYFEE